MNHKIVWVLVNSNSVKEAKYLGDNILSTRLAACYSLVPKLLNKYYWPPKTKRFEINKGPMLILETLPKNYKKIVKQIKKLHSDKVPFIGVLDIGNVEVNFFNWMKGELV